MTTTTCKMCEEHKEARKRWQDGPWQTEPDHVAFRHAGLPCVLHRGGTGAWCGYVAVPPGHPMHGKAYDEGGEADPVEVHGGLTYASPCSEHVCHVPEPGEPDDVWWVGFDCAHSGDLCPCTSRERFFRQHEHYWTVDEVRKETERLAEQLATMMQ